MKLIKEIKFINHDGSVEDYDEERMLRFLNRLGIQKPEELLEDFCEEVNGTMRTNEVISTLERVAARHISPTKPHWENDAASLYLAAALNRDWNGKYPQIEDLKSFDKINLPMYNQFTDEQIKELNDYMKPERDKKFTYKAISLFHGKYCRDLDMQGKREMPQLAYMRAAMFLGLPQDGKTATDFDIGEVKDFYDFLSLHYATIATPIVINALTKRPQTSSCVLLEVDDTTESLLDVNAKLGTMSAAIAGTAVNIQKIRAKGSTISNGRTSGPVPFIKVFESTVSAWNQGGARPGALCVYFQWWHPDVIDLLSLKSNGGTEENRARKLKYALKVNDMLIDSTMKDEMLTLVSPHIAEDLYGKWGREFEDAYGKYHKDPSTKKIRAREIWAKFMKERAETGNIYVYHEENVNKLSMLNQYIGSSNLCTEVVLPTQANTNFKRYSKF